MRSGAKASSAGTILSAKAISNSVPPAPALSGTLTMLPQPVSEGGTGARIERHLVGRAIEDRRIVPDDRLRAVAVVDVPVDDGDPLGAVVALRLARGDGRIVEQAEAHRTVGLGMMARRPDGAEGVGHAAGHHLVDRQAGGGGGARGDVVAPRAEVGVGLDRRDALVGNGGADFSDVVRGVRRGEQLRRGRCRRAGADEVGEGIRATAPCRWRGCGRAARDARSERCGRGRPDPE